MTDHHTKPLIYKGRAAHSNLASRFEAHTREAFDDGWGNLDNESPPRKTEVLVDSSKSIINYVNSPDIPFDRTINPYRGCEHGCIYCYARPTHAYLGLSPGLDFETRLLIKPDAPSLLKKELVNPRYQCAPIALGMNTDAYQPIEKQYQLTRQILEVLSAAQHPLSIVTKSSMIERDIDLLAPMAKNGLVMVYISVTSLDNTISRRLEPRASAPFLRIETIQRLSEAGIPTGVMVAPVIPALTDSFIEDILAQAASAGAKWAGYVLLRLPLELSQLFEEWLVQHYPLKAQHVLSLIKQSRGGKIYDAEFGKRMHGEGVFAELIAHRFQLAIKRYSLNKPSLVLNTSCFTVPEAWRQLATHPQLDLF